jgi:hypothetical protein
MIYPKLLSSALALSQPAPHIRQWRWCLPCDSLTVKDNGFFCRGEVSPSRRPFGPPLPPLLGASPLRPRRRCTACLGAPPAHRTAASRRAAWPKTPRHPTACPGAPPAHQTAASRAACPLAPAPQAGLPLPPSAGDAPATPPSPCQPTAGFGGKR